MNYVVGSRRRIIPKDFLTKVENVRRKEEEMCAGRKLDRVKRKQKIGKRKEEKKKEKKRQEKKE